MKTRSLILVILVTGLQCVDVLVHIAAGQVEIIRITSNAVIAVAAIAAAFHRGLGTLVLSVGTLSYLALNVVFLIGNGLINPAADAPRFPLFGFVLASAALSLWMMARLKAGPWAR